MYEYENIFFKQIHKWTSLTYPFRKYCINKTRNNITTQNNPLELHICFNENAYQICITKYHLRNLVSRKQFTRMYLKSYLRFTSLDLCLCLSWRLNFIHQIALPNTVFISVMFILYIYLQVRLCITSCNRKPWNTDRLWNQLNGWFKLNLLEENAKTVCSIVHDNY